MARTRNPKMTLRFVAVMLAVLIGPLGLAAEPSAAPEGALQAADVDRALREVLRDRLPLAKRLRAARTALSGPLPEDRETALEAGLSLLGEAPEVGAWILLRARDTAFIPDALITRVRARLLETTPDATLQGRATRAATALLFGARDDGVVEGIASAWPPSPVVGAILRRELPLPAASLDALLDAPTSEVLAKTLRFHRPLLEDLDRAERDGVADQRAGLDALLGRGEAAVLPLIEVVARHVRGGPAGRRLRALQAVTVLGVVGDRRATPILVEALEAPDGWLQAAAAAALGDLGDPAAAVALAHKIQNRGDVLRPRDSWDWPGESATTVSREDWPSVEYYVVDCLAAEALLKLGIPGAASYLIHQKLDPSKSNFRIRVMQDAVDALARFLPPDAPVAAYDVDQGLPQRRAAFDALATWWMEHRNRVQPSIDAEDPGFRREARRMVDRLRGRVIRELQVSHETCVLFGAAATPTLIEALGGTTSNAFRTEIARTLGPVEDERAVPTLLALLSDRTPFVRATATDALGYYVGRHGDMADRIEDALILRLADPAPEVCVAAMKALTSARPSDKVLRALQAHDYALFRGRFHADDREYRMAETIAKLVQEGESHWPQVQEGLKSGERYVRGAWWDLLRRALDLPRHLYDPLPQPSEETWRAPDDDAVLPVLRRRRSP